MAQLKTCTPALAKQVWQATPKPSTRRVATKLRQSGARISHGTVARWKSQGWRSLQQEQQHPLEIARDRLDDAVPVLTGNPMSTAASMVQGSDDRETLEQLSDDELLRRAAREVLIAVVVIARVTMLKATLAELLGKRCMTAKLSRWPRLDVTGSHR